MAAAPGGLARTADEIDESHVRNHLAASLERGVSRVARLNGAIVGEIHACRPVPKVFSHVLSDLTIAVDPRFQGSGIGRLLFGSLLSEVTANHPQILRIELLARESNRRALAFYESLGFRTEGLMTDRIRSIGGGFEADVAMAWLRNPPKPGYPVRPSTTQDRNDPGS